MRRPAVDLDEVAARLIAALDAGEEPSPLDWRHAPWCLWRAEPPLATHDRALTRLLSEIMRSERRGPYRRLASVYLIDYAPERPRIGEIGRALAARAAAAGAPWHDLQRDYRLFEGPEGVRGLTEAALAGRETVPALLGRRGLTAIMAGSGLAEASHLDGLSLLAGRPAASATLHLDQVRGWCLAADNSLLYQAHRAAMVNALVMPFRGMMPSAADRDALGGFLLARFGDPRVKPGNWIGMDEAAAILKRWLTEQSLRQFFDVVDRIAPDGMWKYRRSFWSAYHARDLILNAWVVFGQDGASEARRAFGRDIQFGKFAKGGRKPVMAGHAVLLLDLGRCIVADWSHNGYCNIWSADDPERPRFMNALSYTTDDVRREIPSERTEAVLRKHNIFAHSGSDNYVWQSRVAACIYAMTGHRLSLGEFTVR
ncbi:EH signature domain-containing protein [Methylobacterium platani]|uniref:EH signature domain-containing protein n=1 Tax=Methylobacterium platani TaxID=427683 RepID=UPI001AECFEA6|nr:EH signature domain-containing protein [Methylobacterium platani]